MFYFDDEMDPVTAGDESAVEETDSDDILGGLDEGDDDELDLNPMDDEE